MQLFAAVTAVLLGASIPAAAGQPVSASSEMRFEKPGKTLWDAWYTQTSGHRKAAYFNERFEERGGKLFYQLHSWKNEAGFINEEQFGAQSEMNLRPAFYNYHSNYRSAEKVIDGNVKDGKLLTVVVRSGGSEETPVKRNIPDKTIFSVFFPVWLGQRLKEMKPGKSVSFLTILEDSVETNFGTGFGRAMLEKPDAFSLKTGTVKVTVDYRDLKSTWYVEKTGMPVRIVYPLAKIVLEKVTKAEAERFFGE